MRLEKALLALFIVLLFALGVVGIIYVIRNQEKKPSSVFSSTSTKIPANELANYCYFFAAFVPLMKYSKAFEKINHSTRLEINEVFNKLNKQEGTCEEICILFRNLIKKLNTNQLTPGRQNDPRELIFVLFDAIKDAEGTEHLDSEFIEKFCIVTTDIAQGRTKVTHTCLNPYDNVVTFVHDSLKTLYFEYGSTTDDILHVPEVIIYNNSSVEEENFTNCPKFDFNSKYVFNLRCKNVIYEYELTGFAVHQGTGSRDSGHYISFIKEGNEFIKYNYNRRVGVADKTEIHKEPVYLVYEKKGEINI